MLDLTRLLMVLILDCEVLLLLSVVMCHEVLGRLIIVVGCGQYIDEGRLIIHII